MVQTRSGAKKLQIACRADSAPSPESLAAASSSPSPSISASSSPSSTPSLYITGAVVAFYFFTSLSLVFLNKFLFDKPDLDAPIFITWTQIVVAVVLLRVFLTDFSFSLDIAIKAIPLSVLFLVMLVTSNLCLGKVEVSFYLVARAWTVIFNIAFAYMFYGKKTSWSVIGCCFVIVAGYLIACNGSYGLFELGNQVFFSGSFHNSGLLGLLYGLSASVALSLYSMGMKPMLAAVKDNDWVLMMYLNINVMVMLLPLMYLTGEVPKIMESSLMVQTNFWLLLTFAGISGVLINVASFLQIRYTSALTHNVSGTAKATVQSAIGWMTGAKAVEAETVAGTLIVILGCGAYSIVRIYEEEANKKKGKGA